MGEEALRMRDFHSSLLDGSQRDAQGGGTLPSISAKRDKRGGSFYLTYNRFANRSDTESAYPQFGQFLQLKKKYDPGELFQSEWYRYYRD